jgi:predicted ribosome quality control (RQC) complex YloA/Tae2 family protein
LAKEIEEALSGTYVKNVYSLGESQVLRSGRGEGEDVLVLASPRFGAWVTKKVSERAETTAFTTKLRQELVRSRFVTASQINHDRIFDLVFGDDAKHLIIEMMPPGNIVVTDSAAKILTVLNEVRSPSRRVVKGATYIPPLQRKTIPTDATMPIVTSAIERSKTAGEAIGRTFSLPRKYVTETLCRLGLEDSTSSQQLRGKESHIVEALIGLAGEAEESPRPCICMTPSGEDLLIVSSRAFKTVRTSPSLSELCDDLLLRAATAEETHELNPEERRAEELRSTISNLDSQRVALQADAIRLRELASRASTVQSESELKALLEAAGVKAESELPTSHAAASAIYDRAKQLEKKAAEASRAAADLARKSGKRAEKRKAKTMELPRGKQEWYEKFRWFFTSSGKLAIGGRDAQSNSILVRRHLEPNDTVYHADLFGSPFFILKGGKEQNESETTEVSQATVAFSSAWKTGLGAADAYWVTSDQVSTAAPSGEYLPRGGFLITGKKSFVLRNLVEISVGIDPTGRVVSGPESAIGRVSIAYVTLRPQREKGSETAKRVLKDLQSLLADKGSIPISLDGILRMLPTGGGKVVRKRVGGLDIAESRNA